MFLAIAQICVHFSFQANEPKIIGVLASGFRNAFLVNKDFVGIRVPFDGSPYGGIKTGSQFLFEKLLKGPWGRPLVKNPNIFGPHVKRTYICPGIQFSFSRPLKMQRRKTTFFLEGSILFRPIFVLAASYVKMDFCEPFSVCSVPSRSPFFPF